MLVKSTAVQCFLLKQAVNMVVYIEHHSETDQINLRKWKWC